MFCFDLDHFLFFNYQSTNQAYQRVVFSGLPDLWIWRWIFQVLNDVCIFKFDEIKINQTLFRLFVSFIVHWPCPKELQFIIWFYLIFEFFFDQWIWFLWGSTKRCHFLKQLKLLRSVKFGIENELKNVLSYCMVWNRILTNRLCTTHWFRSLI